MRAPDEVLSIEARLRRVLDLCGAAALAAALVHLALALGRGWPKTPYIDGASADVILGLFGILTVLYAARWFVRNPGAPAPSAGVFGRAPPAWLSPLVRSSGRAAGTAAAVGLVVALATRAPAGEMTLRAYYVAFLVYSVAWRLWPRTFR